MGNLKTWRGVITINVAGKTLEDLADEEDFWEFIKTLNRKYRWVSEPNLKEYKDHFKK